MIDHELLEAFNENIKLAKGNTDAAAILTLIEWLPSSIAFGLQMLEELRAAERARLAVERDQRKSAEERKKNQPFNQV